MLAELEEGWGGPAGLDWYAPSLKDDPKLQQMWGGFLRTGASPAAGLALLRMNEETDVRPALAAIHVPDARPASQRRPVDRGCARPLSCRAHRRCETGRVARCGPHSLGRRGRGHHDGDPGLSDRRPADAGTGSDAGHGHAHRHRRFDRTRGCDRRRPSGRTFWRAITTRCGGNSRGSRGREVKTTGDGFLATFDGPGRAIQCAKAIAAVARTLGVEVRAGLHTGECELLVQRHRRHRRARRRPRRGKGRSGRGAGFEDGQGPRRGFGHPLRASRHAYAEGRARQVRAVRCAG